MSVIDSFVEVKLADEEAFLKICETLSRIGVSSKTDKVLFQTAHILHKQGRYYLVHFKELFLLDGKETDFTQEDKGRRNTIACLLEEWELIRILEGKESLKPKVTMNQIKIVKHSEKKDWKFVQKYSLGKYKGAR